MIVKKIKADGYSFFSTPLVVNIQLSNYCNVNCPMCYLHENESNRVNMDTNMLTKYLIELKQIGCNSITFGQCEPMLCNNIFKATESALDIGFSVKIVTSGIGTNYNKLRRLSEIGIHEISVSINSFNQELNDISRVGFKSAISTINIAKSLGMKVCVNYVAQNSTMESFSSYLNTAFNLGVDNVCILRNKRTKKSDAENLNSELLKKTADIIKNENRLQIVLEECFCELKCLITSRNAADIQGCSIGKTAMAITADGAFIPCPHLYDLKEYYSSISDYWFNSPILNSIRKIKLNGDMCNSCVHKIRCSPCQALYLNNCNTFVSDRRDCSVYEHE